MNGKELEFTHEGLLAIAEMALERETGVRALRAILEDLLLDLLYELPSRKDEDTFVFDSDVVTGERALARGLTAADLDEEKDDDDDSDADPERESA